MSRGRIGGCQERTRNRISFLRRENLPRKHGRPWLDFAFPAKIELQASNGAIKIPLRYERDSPKVSVGWILSKTLFCFQTTIRGNRTMLSERPSRSSTPASLGNRTESHFVPLRESVISLSIRLSQPRPILAHLRFGPSPALASPGLLSFYCPRCPDAARRR